ncbi:hypothetical protein F5Y16DRAFT_419237 [Xylariaceae sp. FL0255]|nr:hypothetical protein F5Y16DRAFT_419237 [Xylariaceae sp. FL0255]
MKPFPQFKPSTAVVTDDTDDFLSQPKTTTTSTAMSTSSSPYASHDDEHIIPTSDIAPLLTGISANANAGTTQEDNATIQQIADALYGSRQPSFHQLESYLEANGLLDHFHTLRIHWCSATGLLAIQVAIPRSIHEIFAACLKEALSHQLDRCAHQFPELRPLRQAIGSDHILGVEIETPTDSFTAIPDIRFGFPGTTLPMLVVEIAFSQAPKDLAKKSLSWINVSTVNAVLATRIVQNPGIQTTAMLFPPSSTRGRDENGVIDHTPLCIPFKLFLPHDKQDPAQNVGIALTSDTLCNIMTKAEEAERLSLSELSGDPAAYCHPPLPEKLLSNNTIENHLL